MPSDKAFAKFIKEKLLARYENKSYYEVREQEILTSQCDEIISQHSDILHSVSSLSLITWVDFQTQPEEQQDRSASCGQDFYVPVPGYAR